MYKRLGLEKILNVSVSSRAYASWSRPSRSHLGSRTIASHRDVLCSHADILHKNLKLKCFGASAQKLL